MATPTYGGSNIFDSEFAGSGDTTYNITEGSLVVGSYTAIWQQLHFPGEDGDRLLCIGKHDRQWTYNGLLSAPNMNSLNGLISAIEDAIDAVASDPTHYESLVDSYGNYYPNAQVRNLTYVTPPHAATNGWVAHIVVQGIIQGMKNEGQATPTPPSP